MMMTKKEELEAIRARHSVRKYVDKPLEMDKVASLRDRRLVLSV